MFFAKVNTAPNYKPIPNIDRLQRYWKQRVDVLTERGINQISINDPTWKLPFGFYYDPTKNKGLFDLFIKRINIDYSQQKIYCVKKDGIIFNRSLKAMVIC